MRSLNPRQEQFVLAVAAGRSHRDAARHAGYSEKSSACIGAQLAREPRIAARIRELRERRKSCETLLMTLCAGGEPLTICNPAGIPIAAITLLDAPAAERSHGR